MFEVKEKPKKVERAFLISAYKPDQDPEDSADLIDELEELVKTLEIDVVSKQIVKIRKIYAKFYLGTGKTAELISEAKNLKCDCIIFDNALTPAQQKNWEKEANLCVIDRHEVILDIFSKRAQSKEARLQVGLARMEYSMPRLTRMWAHLDRQRGGSGGSGARAQGETQLEIDRRLANKKVASLKKSLEKIQSQRKTQRKSRARIPLPNFAIVGYTNAGKSTLLNQLAKSDKLAEDKLFATLDTATRKISLENGQDILLTDTVGFVRNLPHSLVEAFKSTLEETALADYIIHVVNADSKNFYSFYETTRDVLNEIGAQDTSEIIVVNKIDKVKDDIKRLNDLKRKFPKAIHISAKLADGIPELLKKFNQVIESEGKFSLCNLKIPQSRADISAKIHNYGKILSEEYEGNFILLSALVPKKIISEINDFITK